MSPRPNEQLAGDASEEPLRRAYRLAVDVERIRTHAAAPLLSEAKVLVRMQLERRPDDAEAKLLLARLSIWTDHVDEAEALCESVLEDGFDYLALHLRGLARLHRGDLEGSIRDLKVLNAINPNHGLLAWNLCCALFLAGDFEEGWRTLERGNRVIANSYPDVPSWRGEPIDGKRVVFTQYNAAGGGDDIVLAHMLHEAMASTASAYIETEPRAERLYRQSFPGATIFRTGETPWRSDGGADVQIPVPTLGLLLRRRRSDFGRPSGYMQADPAAVRRWRTYLQGVAGANTLKVGICWRSMVSIGLTGPFSSSLEDWGDILQSPGVSFFVLQYDECEAEVRAAEQRFGVKLHRLHGIDLMREFDGIAAVARALDLVISAVTTVGIIANAAGAAVWELRPASSGLCISVLPWFPNRTEYPRRHDESWRDVLAKIGRDLRARVRHG